MTARPRLNIGLIGAGLMGKSHVFGFATAARVFDLPFEVVLHTLADVTDPAGRQGFRRIEAAPAHPPYG